MLGIRIILDFRTRIPNIWYSNLRAQNIQIPWIIHHSSSSDDCTGGRELFHRVSYKLVTSWRTSNHKLFPRVALLSSSFYLLCCQFSIDFDDFCDVWRKVLCLPTTFCWSKLITALEESLFPYNFFFVSSEYMTDPGQLSSFHFVREMLLVYSFINFIICHMFNSFDFKYDYITASGKAV